jgi:hypothetical protein
MPKYPNVQGLWLVVYNCSTSPDVTKVKDADAEVVEAGGRYDNECRSEADRITTMWQAGKIVIGINEYGQPYQIDLGTNPPEVKPKLLVDPKECAGPAPSSDTHWEITYYDNQCPLLVKEIKSLPSGHRLIPLYTVRDYASEIRESPRKCAQH